MADKTIIEQMLEHLVNGDKAKAEELFHEYVVTTSRDIYESLIDSEIEETTEDDLDEDSEKNEDDLDEASDEQQNEDDLDENFDEVAVEGDDEESGIPGSEEKTGNLETDIKVDGEGDDEGDLDEPATKGDVMDIKDDVAELLAAFDEYKSQEGGEKAHDGMDDIDSMMGKDSPKMDSLDMELETVREYVEKVSGGHGAEKKGSGESSGANTQSIVAGKNDMGGTTANIVSGRNGADAGHQGMTGDLKGSGLLKGKPQAQDGGNINVPGGNAGKTSFKHKEPGHGAEKKGTGEQGGTNTTSLFRRK